MKVNDAVRSSVMDVFNGGGIFTTKEISKRARISEDLVRRTICSLRKAYRNGVKMPYIYTTGQGYSTDERPAHALYEGNMRIRMGVGILTNGMPVFKKCKQLASVQFAKMNIELKPKMIQLNKLL